MGRFTIKQIFNFTGVKVGYYLVQKNNKKIHERIYFIRDKNGDPVSYPYKTTLEYIYYDILYKQERGYL